MSFKNTFIPYGGYWSTPFCRWQGSLADSHSIKLAASVTQGFLGAREIAPTAFDALHLGISVPQASSFSGAPWLASMIGAEGITGPTIAQACATSVRLIAGAGLEVEAGIRDCTLAVACDRTSNGPHVYYPGPNGPGGTGTSENPVMDNFNRDPNARLAMIQTAENVAKRAGIERAEQDEMALLRSEQYADALASDREFQKRYMVAVEIPRGRKKVDIGGLDELITTSTVGGEENVAANITICDRVNLLRTPEE